MRSLQYLLYRANCASKACIFFVSLNLRRWTGERHRVLLAAALHRNKYLTKIRTAPFAFPISITSRFQESTTSCWSSPFRLLRIHRFMRQSPSFFHGKILFVLFTNIAGGCFHVLARHSHGGSNFSNGSGFGGRVDDFVIFGNRSAITTRRPPEGSSCRVAEGRS